jgi:DNA-directed RNA polymerase specialized sigma24 family protein
VEGGVTSSEEFERLTAPLRRELVAHCYRMTGSADEAEDMVQETYLRAWRSYARFEGRSSLRTWLYRIATNVCLRAIQRRDRRPLPAGLGPPDGSYQAHAIQVLSTASGRISRIVIFLNPGLFPAFGLPRSLGWHVMAGADVSAAASRFGRRGRRW